MSRTLAEVLGDLCIDWNGEPLVDGTETRIPLMCGQLRAILAERAAMERALKAASHALRSYQYGNSATDLAKATADHCDAVLEGEKP